MDIQIDYTSKFIFRMIHYSNLEFILKHGLYTKNSRMKDPEYINIGGYSVNRTATKFSCSN